MSEFDPTYPQFVTPLRNPESDEEDDHIILEIAAVDANTPAPAGPTLADEQGYHTQNSGILTIMLRDPNKGGAGAFVSGDFQPWFNYPQVVDEWLEGEVITHDVTADGYLFTLNLQGATRVFLRMVSKTVGASQLQLFAGRNTLPGA